MRNRAESAAPVTSVDSDVLLPSHPSLAVSRLADSSAAAVWPAPPDPQQAGPNHRFPAHLRAAARVHAAAERDRALVPRKAPAAPARRAQAMPLASFGKGRSFARGHRGPVMTVLSVVSAG